MKSICFPVIANVASCYQENGQLERAVSYYEEALTINRKQLPSSHPSLARGKVFLTSSTKHVEL